MSEFSTSADAPHAVRTPLAARVSRAGRVARVKSLRLTRSAVLAGRTSRGRAGYLAGALVVICALLAISPAAPGTTAAATPAAAANVTAAEPLALTTAALTVNPSRSLTPLAREVHASRARAAHADAVRLAKIRAQIRHAAAVRRAKLAKIRAHKLALHRYWMVRVRVLPIWRHYVIGEGFGVRGWHWGGGVHTGIDLDVPTGTHVHAAMAGTIISAQWEGSYGNCIRIRHYNGVVTRYAHLSRIKVHVGQYVQAGQVIGNSGATGNTTGPHLHFEVIIHGVPVNPRSWLR